MVNKENHYDNVFHLYNHQKVHVEFEFQQQIIHLKYIFNLISFFPQIKNLQAHKAKTNAPNSIQ
jgi:hypothetical protein